MGRRMINTARPLTTRAGIILVALLAERHLAICPSCRLPVPFAPVDDPRVLAYECECGAVWAVRRRR